MRIKLLICSIYLVLISNFHSISQEGPAGVLGDSENRFWLAADFENFNDGDQVDIWSNQGGNPLDGVTVSTGSRPTYRDNLIDNLNSYPVIDFDGVNDMIWIQDNSDLNTAEVSQRTMFFTFRTSVDVNSRQYIYQEGGGTRGLGVYVFNNQLFIAAWNFANDGPGSPWGHFSASTPILSNTAYNISFVFDGNNGTNGSMTLNVNGQAAAAFNNVGLLYAHGNDISIGACKNTTVHETGTFSGDGLYFQGDIAEVIYYNEVLNSSRINLIDNYLSSKYNIALSSGDNYLMDNLLNGDFDAEMFGLSRQNGSNLNSDAKGQGIVRVNNASALSNNEFLMIGHDMGDLSEGLHPVPVGLDFRLNRIWRASEAGEVGDIDLTMDISSYVSAGNDVGDYFLLVDQFDTDFSDATQYPATTLVNGVLSFNLVDIDDGNYFTLGVITEEVGNTGRGGVHDNSVIRFWFDASDFLYSLSNNDLVANWPNKGGNSNDAFQSSSSSRPQYRFNTTDNINGHPVLNFDGSNDHLRIADNGDLNTQFATERSFTMVFETGSNVINRQVLYEEGGTARGLNIYIVSGNIHFGGWNQNNDGAGAPWLFTSASAVINTNTTYILNAIYKGSSSLNGTLDLYLNGALVSSVSNVGYLYPHSADIGIGRKQNDTYFETGASGGNGNHFSGKIAEFIIYNRAISATQNDIINNSLSAKYGLVLGSGEQYQNDNAALGDFDYDVAGIGWNNNSFPHRDARGTGPVRGFDADDMGAGEFMLWGHDSASICNSQNSPGEINRLNRVWRVAEQGNVGATSLSFDVQNFGLSSLSDVRLLIDSDTDFSDATISLPSSSSGTEVQFDNIDISNLQYFTFASISESFIDLENVTVWTGGTSSDWATGSNWTNGVPNNRTSASITSGSPTLSVNAEVKDLYITAGASLTLSSSPELSINGSLLCEGTITPGSSTVILSESCGQSSIQLASSQIFYNLEIANSSGVNNSAAEIQIQNILRLTNGEFITGDSLLLKSNASGTARIAEITGGSISGIIENQRYIDAGETNWRFLTFPVSGADLEQFDDDFITSGIPGSDYPNWPSTANPWESFYFYEENLGTSFNDGFQAPSSMSEIVSPGQGVWIWCGDTITGTQPFTIDVRGPANTGDINLPVSFNVASGSMDDDGWNMVANPYPCTIDWNDPSWTKTNIENAIYIWNPDLQQYATYVAGVGLNGGSNQIASSQAFMVHADASNPVLTVRESCKVDSDQGFLKAGTINDLLRLKIQNQSSSDELVVRFDDNASNGFDIQIDARKAKSSLSSELVWWTQTNGVDYAVNSLKTPSAEVIIPIHVSTNNNDSINLKISDISALDNINCAKLIDLKTGYITNLKVDTLYTFWQTLFDNGHRFNLVFRGEAQVETENSICYSGAEGSAILLDSSSYTFYSWSDENGFLTNQASIENLSPGDYYLTASSSYCGMDTVTIEILNGLDNFANLDIVNSSCSSCCDGEIILPQMPAGAEVLLNGQSYTLPMNGLCNGTYTLNYVDENLCEQDTIINLGVVNGIDEQEISCSVYPNPVKSKLEIQADLTLRNWALINTAGKVILSDISNNKQTQIDVEGLSEGIYFLQLNFDEGRATRKILIQR
jgi:hypothetical protein